MALLSSDTLLDVVLISSIAAFWSFLMASLVAPRMVALYLRRRMDRINDPNDKFATSMRKASGSIFAMATTEIGKNPGLLSPVVGAFWHNIRQRAIGAKGGMSAVVPEDMMSVAMEEGPEAIAGIAEMFGVSGRAAKAFGRMASSYAAKRLMGAEGSEIQGAGGPEWWEQR